MTKQAERDYPLKVDQAHLYRRPFDDPRVLRESALVVDLFRRHVTVGSILDLGCGSGWTSRFLARAGFQVVGVDIAERLIEIARECSAREDTPVEYLVADMEELDLQKRDFDGALFFDCLHHSPGYENALRRACEHLRPGGCLLLFETTWLHRYSPHAREISRKYGVTELGFSRRQLRRALSRAGFRTVVQHHDLGVPFRGPGGFLKANLRLWCGYLFCFPQAKNIFLARK